jgi:hypothetical protein
MFAPAAMFFVVAWVAGAIGGSFRSGLRAGSWAGVLGMPLGYAVHLHESLRMYSIEGGTRLFGDGTEAENLTGALVFGLVVVVGFGLPFAMIGAAVGSRHRRPGVRGCAVRIT